MGFGNMVGGSAEQEAAGQAGSEWGLPGTSCLGGQGNKRKQKVNQKPRNNKADSAHDECVCAKIKLGLFSWPFQLLETSDFQPLSRSGRRNTFKQQTCCEHY